MYDPLAALASPETHKSRQASISTARTRVGQVPGREVPPTTTWYRSSRSRAASAEPCARFAQRSEIVNNFPTASIRECVNGGGHVFRGPVHDRKPPRFLEVGWNSNYRCHLARGGRQ